MRRSIVEGEDYSVLPMPVVQLMSWFRKRFGADESPVDDSNNSPGDANT